MYPRVWALANKGIFPRELSKSCCSNSNSLLIKSFFFHAVVCKFLNLCCVTGSLVQSDCLEPK